MVVKIETDRRDADAADDAERILLIHRAAPDRLRAACLECTCTHPRFLCRHDRWALKVTVDAAESRLP